MGRGWRRRWLGLRGGESEASELLTGPTYPLRAAQLGVASEVEVRLRRAVTVMPGGLGVRLFGYGDWSFLVGGVRARRRVFKELSGIGFRCWASRSLFSFAGGEIGGVVSFGDGGFGEGVRGVVR
jgi:hypothetical protein